MRTSPTCACLHAEYPLRATSVVNCAFPNCGYVSRSQAVARLRQGLLRYDHEGAVRSAFQDLLAKCGRKAKPPLTLVPEYRIERARSSVIVDGALVDLYHLPH